MTFASWEDSGVNWNDPRGCDAWAALESIRLALVERASAAGNRDAATVGYTLPTILQSEVVRGSFIYDYTSAIQTAVSALILSFLNHSKNNGEINGESTSIILSVWTVSEVKGYGYRTDGTPKGQGYFGELIRYDDPESYSTELTVDTDNGGIPLLVPTLTDDQVRWLLSNNGWTPEILAAAEAYAEYRRAAGKSPFAQDGEQNPRAWMPTFTHKLSPLWHWIRQQHQIINNLRYIYGGFTWPWTGPLNPEFYNYELYHKIRRYWNNIWGDIDWYREGDQSWGRYLYGEVDWESWDYVSAKLRFSVPNSFPCITKIYLSAFPSASDYDWMPCDQLQQPNILYKIINEEQLGENNIFSVELTGYNFNYSYPSKKMQHIGSIKWIKDFTGPNGFKFKNW